jgi:RHS repeat-associated protein
MLQPNRNGPGTKSLAGGYRYGYNGKEMDNNGELGLTTYDYGFRIYNPGLGRFLSVDPLTSCYPMLTPYQFSSNNPIQNIDLDGLEGVQYILNIKQQDGSVIAMAKVVEVNVYVAVTENAADGMNYKVGDSKRIQNHLNEGYQNIRHKNGDVDFVDDKTGLPVLFKFNVIETKVLGSNDQTQRSIELTKLSDDIQAHSAYTPEGGELIRPSILVARLLPALDLKGGKGASYGNSSIVTAPGSTPGTSDEADKAVIHEMMHGFLSYNPNLSMGDSRAKHNDAALGGTGALQYGSNTQQKANKTNVGKVLETIPTVKDKTVSEEDYNTQYSPAIKIKGQKQ